MPIRAECPGCGKVYQVPEAMAGKRAKCKACGGAVPIPAAATMAASPPQVPKPRPAPAAPKARPMPAAPAAPSPAAVAALDPSRAKLQAALRGKARPDEKPPGTLFDKLTSAKVLLGVPLAIAVLVTALWFISQDAYETVALVPAALGALVFVAGMLWFIGVGFTVSAGWTLVMIIVGCLPLQLFAASKIIEGDPDRAKPPFFIAMSGMLTVLVCFIPEAIKSAMGY